MISQDDYGRAYAAGKVKTTRMLIRHGINSDIAEEAMQAAWVRGWARREQLRDPAKLLVWINSIALNIARSEMKRQTRVAGTMVDPVVEPLRAVPISLDVSRTLGQCPKRERALIARRYLRGWSIRDLASHEHSTQGAIRVRLMRARNNLRHLLQRPTAA